METYSVKFRDRGNSLTCLALGRIQPRKNFPSGCPHPRGELQLYGQPLFSATFARVTRTTRRPFGLVVRIHRLLRDSADCEVLLSLTDKNDSAGKHLIVSNDGIDIIHLDAVDGDTAGRDRTAGCTLALL